MLTSAFCRHIQTRPPNKPHSYLSKVTWRNPLFPANPWLAPMVVQRILLVFTGFVAVKPRPHDRLHRNILGADDRRVSRIHAGQYLAPDQDFDVRRRIRRVNIRGAPKYPPRHAESGSSCDDGSMTMPRVKPPFCAAPADARPRTRRAPVCQSLPARFCCPSYILHTDSENLRDT